jgi:hypothetical protein
MGYSGEFVSWKYDKAEQAALVLLRLTRGLDGKVLDHAVVSSVLYAAIQKPDGEVFAAIVPFELVKRGSAWELLYEMDSETVGPCDVKCPVRILNMLSPTCEEYAIKWREKCRARTKNRQTNNK